MDLSLQQSYLEEVNNVRKWLYSGPSSEVNLTFLKMNSTNEEFEPQVTIITDFMLDFTSSGRMSFELATGEYDNLIYKSSHIVWKEKVFELVQPIKPSEGPFPLWALFADPTRQRYPNL